MRAILACAMLLLSPATTFAQWESLTVDVLVSAQGNTGRPVTKSKSYTLPIAKRLEASQTRWSLCSPSVDCIGSGLSIVTVRPGSLIGHVSVHHFPHTKIATAASARVQLRGKFSEPTQLTWQVGNDSAKTRDYLAGDSFSFDKLVQVATTASPSDRDKFIFRWSTDGLSLPGTSTENSLPEHKTGREFEAKQEFDQVITEEGSHIANDIVGAYLTSRTPVPIEKNGTGHTSPVYFSASPAPMRLYHVDSENRFTTLEVFSDLGGDDTQLEIWRRGVAYPFSVGETFDFATIDPAGVDTFLLTGMDYPDDASLVLGATFANAGVPTVTSFPLIERIQGDYNRDGAVNASDYTLWRDTVGDSSWLVADGNDDGSVDQADYDIVKLNFGATAANSVLRRATVPERATSTLVGLLALHLLLSVRVNRG